MMNMTVVKVEINSDVNGMITRDEMTEDVLGNMTGTNSQRVLIYIYNGWSDFQLSHACAFTEQF